MVGAMNSADRVAFRRIAESIFGQHHVCIDAGTHWHLVIETACTDTALAEWGLSLEDLKPWVRREIERANVKN
jgi:hypothetical protein